MGFLDIPPVVTQRLEWTLAYAPMRPELVLGLLRHHVHRVEFTQGWRRGTHGCAFGLQQALSEWHRYGRGSFAIELRGDRHFDETEITLHHELGHAFYEDSYARHHALRRRTHPRERSSPAANPYLERLLDDEARRFRREHRDFSRELLLSLLGKRRTHRIFAQQLGYELVFPNTVLRDDIRAIVERFEGHGWRPTLELRPLTPR